MDFIVFVLFIVFLVFEYYNTHTQRMITRKTRIIWDPNILSIMFDKHYYFNYFYVFTKNIHKYRLKIQHNVYILISPTRDKIIIVMNNVIIKSITNSYNCHCDTTNLSIADCVLIFTIQVQYLQIIKNHEMNLLLCIECSYILIVIDAKRRTSNFYLLSIVSMVQTRMMITIKTHTTTISIFDNTKRGKNTHKPISNTKDIKFCNRDKKYFGKKYKNCWCWYVFILIKISGGCTGDKKNMRLFDSAAHQGELSFVFGFFWKRTSNYSNNN